MFLLVNNKIQKLIVKEKLISYLDNILAAVAVISHLLGFKNISENIFYNFNLLEGRGDFKKIKIKSK